MNSFWTKLKTFFANLFATPAVPTPIQTPPAVNTPAQIDPPAVGGKAWLEIALAITSAYEGLGFQEVTGDFDGQGMSLGILQWNFGQGTIQPLLAKFIKTFGSIDALRIFPLPIDHLATESVSTSLDWVRKNMLDGKVVKPAWKLAWQHFLGTENMKATQVAGCASYDKIAQKICTDLGFQSLRAYCWAFDVAVQEGGLKGLGLPKVDRARCAKIIQEMDTSKAGGINTGANKKLWSTMLGTFSDEQICMMILTDQRAKLGNLTYYCDVVNRKGALAAGSGWVHNSFFTYPQLSASAPKPPPSPAPTSSATDTLLSLCQLVGLSEVPMQKMLALRDAKYPDSNPNFWAVVDFTLHSSKKRFFLFDVKARSITMYLVAHGSGSEGPTDDGFANVFSNVPGSEASSLGIYRCAEPYTGKHGLSLKLDGLESTNSNVRARSVVLHSADYVSDDYIAKTGRIGRSNGCFAMEASVVPKMIEGLKNGSFLIAWKSN